jgi:hypothetical protein
LPLQLAPPGTVTTSLLPAAGEVLREQGFEAARAGGEKVVHGQKGFTTTRMQMAVKASTGTSLKKPEPDV